MTKVYTAPSLQLIYHLKNMLENHGIKCRTKGEARFMGLGEIPPNECWIDLLVVDDNLTVKATNLINQFLSEQDQNKNETWACVKCGEEVEGQFTECWKCGASRVK